MTKFSKIIDAFYSYVQFTKRLLLKPSKENQKLLWQEAKLMLWEYENEEDGCVIIDNMILNKPHTAENDIVCYHFDHTVNRSVKGIRHLQIHMK